MRAWVSLQNSGGSGTRKEEEKTKAITEPCPRRRVQDRLPASHHSSPFAGRFPLVRCGRGHSQSVRHLMGRNNVGGIVLRGWALTAHVVHGTFSQVGMGLDLSETWQDSGIAQGGVLSSLLFNILVDGLAQTVHDASPGVSLMVNWDSRFAGKLYADDTQTSLGAVAGDFWPTKKPPCVQCDVGRCCPHRGPGTCVTLQADLCPTCLAPVLDHLPPSPDDGRNQSRHFVPACLSV